MRSSLAIGLAFALIGTAPTTAEAFCGFYVSGAEGKLFNNATQVVMMRHKTRTVLSMQNNYQGPPKDFAMVVPVPVVLQKENVKTLPHDVFKKVDALAAPRLVEYWEKDPCAVRHRYKDAAKTSAAPRRNRRAKKGKKPDDLGVTIEAKFAVGEYQIVILGAKDSSGLDKWLRREGYKIPKGAEPLLRPYVQQGMKFFVAKVDIKKVTKGPNGITLSPLRFHYDSEKFSLPVRLGLMNAKGAQDLIVHILAPGKRYEAANYKNVFIPTNLDVTNDTRKNFGEFYAALFDATLKKNPGAVVTEYSWDSSTCDPCPTPPLRYRELALLGRDVLYQAPTIAVPPGGKAAPTAKKAKPGAVAPPVMRRRRRPRRRWRRRGGMVLTRLHARYTKASMTNDLVFKEAAAVVGGREIRRGANRSLEEGAKSSYSNRFQGRYAIRHKWTGPVDCKNPQFGRWGGPPRKSHRSRPKAQAALDLAFATRGKRKLASFVKTDIKDLGVKAAGAPAVTKQPPPATTTPPKTTATPNKQDKKKKKKGCSVSGSDGGTGFALLMLGVALMIVRRKRG